MRTTTIEIEDDIYNYLKNELRKGHLVRVKTVFIDVYPNKCKETEKPTKVIINNIAEAK